MFAQMADDVTLTQRTNGILRIGCIENQKAMAFKNFPSQRELSFVVIYAQDERLAAFERGCAHALFSISSISIDALLPF